MLYPGVPYSPPDVVVVAPPPEDDYRYFRLSKFGIPLLILILAIFVTVICLTAWQSRSDIRQLRPGVPRDVEANADSTDDEGGVPLFKRALRFAITFLGIFLVLIALAVFVIPLSPVARARINYVLAILLILSGILALITFAFDINSERDAEGCTRNRHYTVVCKNREDMTTGLTLWDICMALFFFLSGCLILAYSRSGDWTRAREKEMAVLGGPGVGVMPGLYPNGVSFVRKTLTLISLFLLLAFSILCLVFTIYIHELRTREEIRDVNNRLPSDGRGGLVTAGWPERNTKLRYATCSLIILTILFNFIPLNSRIIAYILGFLYICYAVMAFVCFAIDIDEIENAKKLICPDGFTCKYHPYSAIAAIEFIGAFLLIIFVLLEYFVWGRKKKPIAPAEVVMS